MPMTRGPSWGRGWSTAPMLGPPAPQAETHPLAVVPGSCKRSGTCRKAGEDPKAGRGTLRRGREGSTSPRETTHALSHPGGSRNWLHIQTATRPLPPLAAASPSLLQKSARPGRGRPTAKARAAPRRVGVAGDSGTLTQNRRREVRKTRDASCSETPLGEGSLGGGGVGGIELPHRGVRAGGSTHWISSRPQSRREARSKDHKTLYRRDPQAAPQPRGAAPPSRRGGSGTGRAGSPSPAAAPGETRGEGAQVWRACTTPPVWGQRSPELGSVPRGDAGGRSRGHWHDDCGAELWQQQALPAPPWASGRPPQQHSPPGALLSLAVTAKPRQPRHRSSGGSSSLQHADFPLLILLTSRLSQRLWHCRHILHGHHLLP